MKLSLVEAVSEKEIGLDAEEPVIIGRGSQLGCSDKKVSRNHGKLQLTPEGNVLLVALHSNPCFIMRDGLPPVDQLDKGQQEVLKDGDYIGLLPDSFWYKIVVKKNDSSISPDCPLNNTNDLRSEPKPSKQGENANSIQDASDSKNDTICETDIDKESGKLDNACNQSKPVEISVNSLAERLKALEHTKKLPLSMYEIDDFSGIGHGQLEAKMCNSSSYITPQSVESSKKDESPSCSTDNHTDDKHTATSSQIKSQDDIKTNQKEVQTQESQLENVAHSSKTNGDEVKTDDTKDATKDSNINSGASHGRPLCIYEEKCYRKNEDHRREFCHPGDSDFIPYERRPKCQYGASCYRRNKTHHVEYQHPNVKKPKGQAAKDSPKRKRQKKKETYRDTSEEEDDLDLEDPFAADGSSDEFIPSGLDSDN